MLKTRKLKLRGKPAHVQEVGDLYAVRGPSADLAGSALDAASVVSAAPGIQQAALEALQKAGWQFVRAEQPPPAGAPVAKVFVKSGGRPVLGLNRLTVKLTDKMTESQAKELIAQHGGRI